MPWEKSFDESDVIDHAMNLFWEKGYAATTISDITERTGLKRGSLYNAFDGKDDLFFRSLQQYCQAPRQQLLAQLEKIESPSAAIRKLFQTIVNDTLADPDKKGCMLVNTALECSHQDERIKKLIAEGFKEMTSFFERKISEGQELGEIKSSAGPKKTAKALLSCVIGIRVLGRGVFGKSVLNQIASEASRLIA